MNEIKPQILSNSIGTGRETIAIPLEVFEKVYGDCNSLCALVDAQSKAFPSVKSTLVMGRQVFATGCISHGVKCQMELHVLQPIQAAWDGPIYETYASTPRGRNLIGLGVTNNGQRYRVVDVIKVESSLPSPSCGIDLLSAQRFAVDGANFGYWWHEAKRAGAAFVVEVFGPFAVLTVTPARFKPFSKHLIWRKGKSIMASFIPEDFPLDLSLAVPASDHQGQLTLF